MKAETRALRDNAAALLAFVERLVELHEKFVSPNCRCNNCVQGKALIQACKPQEVTA